MKEEKLYKSQKIFDILSYLNTIEVNTQSEFIEFINEIKSLLFKNEDEMEDDINLMNCLYETKNHIDKAFNYLRNSIYP